LLVYISPILSPGPVGIFVFIALCDLRAIPITDAGGLRT
jgi:hypothetical protein